MIYDQLKSYLSNGTGVTSPGVQILSGGFSKAVAIVLTYPYQLIRSALQANNSPYKGMTDAAQTVCCFLLSTNFSFLYS